MERPVFDANKELIGLVKWSELGDYLTSRFMYMYNMYERFELGFGLPGGKPWDKQPDHIMKLLDIFIYESRKSGSK